MNLNYTTISPKQIRILQAYNITDRGKEISLHMTNNMLKYLYIMAKQKEGHAFDKQEEEFRQQISNSVGIILDKTRPEEERILKADSIIRQAFIVLCCHREGEMLGKIQEEIQTQNGQNKQHT